ncbi:DNA-processing protein DprA [Luteimonas sp. RIT-PG2_3]
MDDCHDCEERDALLVLLDAGGASAPRRGLLERHGSARAAVSAGPAAWRAAGLDGAQCRALADARPAAATLRWLEAAPQHHLLGWQHPDYPPLLRQAGNPPLALYVIGDPARLWHPAVAVVGSRSPSAGGRAHARSFSQALARSGLAIASGLAAGIDTIAHATALAEDAITVAVLGTGIDVPYPRANAGLYRQIGQAGAIVSEHPPGTGPRREHFPSRNRIIAGLALGTLVVEAAERSGALITARLAGDAGREVFAVPGSIHNPMARGCHRLIRQGAALVEDAREVVEALAPLAGELGAALQHRLAIPIWCAGTPDGMAITNPAGAPADTPVAPGRNVDADYQKLWRALGHDPTCMDQLVARTGLTTADLSSMLLIMELEDRVVVEHGRYSRTSHIAPEGAGRGK